MVPETEYGEKVPLEAPLTHTKETVYLNQNA